MRLARDAGDDRAQARVLLAQSRADAQRMGMGGLLERLAATQARADATPSAETFPAGLSAREAQVLRLVASGRGNREIAAALFVSPNTVASHVRAILAKTGAANRTEAAAFAIRHGLADE
jgi:DNA-binding NarL/FixJ family response regulator